MNILDILFTIAINMDNPVRIAVIDTGFGPVDSGHEVTLCDRGHANFLNSPWFLTPRPNGVPIDSTGHGTAMIGLVEQGATGLLWGDLSNDRMRANLQKLPSRLYHCQIVVRALSAEIQNDDALAIARGVDHAVAFGADVINISATGEQFNLPEFISTKRARGLGVWVVAAAGNEGVSIEEEPRYPASLSHVIGVGAVDVNDSLDRTRSRVYRHSNYSDGSSGFFTWHFGGGVATIHPRATFSGSSFIAITSGTSAASALYSGELARKISNIRNKVRHYVNRADNMCVSVPTQREINYIRSREWRTYQK